MTQELKDLIHARAQAVQRRYDRRGPLFRALWLAGAVVVILAGLAMTVLPGPAVVVIPVGVAMLAARFRWAQRLLRATIDHGVTWHRRMSGAHPVVRVGVAAVGAAGVVALAVALWR